MVPVLEKLHLEFVNLLLVLVLMPGLVALQKNWVWNLALLWSIIIRLVPTKVFNC